MTAVPAVTVGASGHDRDSRGTTALADRVVEKIAARAATEVEHCVGIPRTVVGITTGHTTVHAEATCDGGIAGLRLKIGIAYPASVLGTTREVRGHVSEVVARLCGLTVDHVDIDVAALVRPPATTGRVR